MAGWSLCLTSPLDNTVKIRTSGVVRNVFSVSSPVSLIISIAYSELFFSVMSIFDKLVCLGDYPLTAGMGSLCTINRVIFSDMMFWRTSVGKDTELQPKSYHLFVCVFWKLTLCIMASRRLRMSLPLPPPFEGGSNKKAQWVQQAVLPSYTLRLSTWRWIGGPSITQGEKRTFYWRLRMWGDAP